MLLVSSLNPMSARDEATVRKGWGARTTRRGALQWENQERASTQTGLAPVGRVAGPVHTSEPKRILTETFRAVSAQ